MIGKTFEVLQVVHPMNKSFVLAEAGPMLDADLEEVLRLRDKRDATPGDRRRIISHLVVMLSGMTYPMNGYDERSQISIERLTAVIQAMTNSIATADDATFSAIVREAALLIRTLRHRQADFSRSTIH